MSLIGITGTMGSGKDVVAKMIQIYFLRSKFPDSEYNFIELLDDTKNTNHFDKFFPSKQVRTFSGYEIKKFASKLKQIGAILLSCKEEDFEDSDFKNKINIFGITNRKLLQFTGTEFGRNLIDENIWIKTLLSSYNIHKNWIISDVRFVNEVEAIQDNGGKVIKLLRNHEINDTHQSETEIYSIEQDYTIDNRNTNLEQLYHEVEIILNEITSRTN